MATYDITINISPGDVSILREQGYSIYAFKSVESAGEGELTVWYHLKNEILLTFNKITWEENFEGYNSVSKISERTQIETSNDTPTGLGDLITIDKAGNLNNTNNGSRGSISFVNDDTKQFTVGISQIVFGENNVLCAFPILGKGGTRVITPILKVALIFSTEIINPGVIITKAMSDGALIDLTGVSSQSVDFSLDSGWSANYGNNDSWFQLSMLSQA